MPPGLVEHYTTMQKYAIKDTNTSRQIKILKESFDLMVKIVEKYDQLGLGDGQDEDEDGEDDDSDENTQNEHSERRKISPVQIG